MPAQMRPEAGCGSAKTVSVRASLLSAHSWQRCAHSEPDCSTSGRPCRSSSALATVGSPPGYLHFGASEGALGTRASETCSSVKKRGMLLTDELQPIRSYNSKETDTDYILIDITQLLLSNLFVKHYPQKHKTNLCFLFS